MSIKIFSSKEAKNSFGSFLDSAQREPIMITKRDRPVWVFFSMQDVSSLIQVSDAFKKEIHEGILAWIADIEAGRFKKFNKNYATDLKARVRTKLENNQNI